MSDRNERLYRPEWFEHINKGQPITFTYGEIPIEELLILDTMTQQFPGLMFNLRKQRGARYLLTIMPLRHVDKEVVKGES